VRRVLGPLQNSRGLTVAPKEYNGIRDKDGSLHVTVRDPDDGKQHLLPLRLDLASHSPTGFECGYEGSGPAQLALALLADALKDDALAVQLHQDFKSRVIAGFPRDKNWVISLASVLAFVKSQHQ
jgi:hypothetical protein